MDRRRHRHLQPGNGDGAADAHTRNVLQALASEPQRQLVHTHDRRIRVARHLYDAGGVIGMAVRQQDQIGLVDLPPIRRAHRIPLQPRVGDDAFAAGRGDDEGRMSEPGNRKG
jgi:hypothetical protein